MTAPENTVNDFVFAKVRGYPPWPARIISIVDPRPATLKFKVYFYGTAETATVTAKEIFNYEGNKEKFCVGKLTKRKGFLKAIKELEDLKNKDSQSEKGVSDTKEKEPRSDEPSATSAKGAKRRTSEASESVPAKKPKRRASSKPENALDETPNESMGPPDTSARRGSRRSSTTDKEKTDPGKKRKISADKSLKEKEDISKEKIEEEPVPKKKRRSTASENKDTPKSEGKGQTSRSGRVIKPKKFLDDDEQDAEANTKPANHATEEVVVPKVSPRKTKETVEVQLTPRKENEKEDKEKPMPAPVLSPIGRVTYARHKSGQVVQVKIDYERPAKYKDQIYQFGQACKNYEKKIIADIENGESNLPQDVLNQLSTATESKDDGKPDARLLQTSERYIGRRRWADVEKRIMDIDRDIKISLQKDNPKLEKALTLLDELIALPMDPLMLKKFPNITLTISKVLTYKGPASFNKDESKTAKKIQRKSQQIWNRFRECFLVPRGDSAEFWNTFLPAIEEFKAATKDMEPTLVQMLTCDPTSEHFSDVVEMDKQDLEFAKKIEMTQ